RENINRTMESELALGKERLEARINMFGRETAAFAGSAQLGKSLGNLSGGAGYLAALLQHHYLAADLKYHLFLVDRSGKRVAASDDDEEGFDMDWIANSVIKEGRAGARLVKEAGGYCLLAAYPVLGEGGKPRGALIAEAPMSAMFEGVLPGHPTRNWGLVDESGRSVSGGDASFSQRFFWRAAQFLFLSEPFNTLGSWPSPRI
ncbi:MAG: cache domain-containing protein, partial [Candidatus Protistobacter heckmanni]|nr:cache domain-containing protein [Candidatus Protistobacter heckmanni]